MESLTGAVKSLPRAVEGPPKRVESLTGAVKSLPRAVESLTEAVENPPIEQWKVLLDRLLK